jgi:hypothetical protein
MSFASWMIVQRSCSEQDSSPSVRHLHSSPLWPHLNHSGMPYQLRNRTRVTNTGARPQHWGPDCHFICKFLQILRHLRSYCVYIQGTALEADCCGCVLRMCMIAQRCKEELWSIRQILRSSDQLRICSTTQFKEQGGPWSQRTLLEESGVGGRLSARRICFDLCGRSLVEAAERFFALIVLWPCQSYSSWLGRPSRLCVEFRR